MASDTTLAPFGRWRQDWGMPKTNAFVTPRYPVLFSVASAGTSGVPEGEAELVLALLVAGTPSFLAAHRVPDQAVDELVASLQEGDARVAVVGTWVGSEEEISGRMERRAAAFISLVCADGRRITVARVMGEEPDAAPNLLARHVVRQISRGVQVPDLVGR
jgi:hypothetical protein